MKLIGITQEHVFEREEEYITLLLEEGMDALPLAIIQLYSNQYPHFFPSG